MGRVIGLVDLAIVIFFLWIIYKIVAKIVKKINKEDK